MDTEKIKKRAEDARMLIEHPLFNEAFEGVERQLYEAWRDLPSGETEQAERLRLMSKNLGMVRRYLEDIMAEGDHAKLAEELKRRDEQFEALSNPVILDE